MISIEMLRNRAKTFACVDSDAIWRDFQFYKKSAKSELRPGKTAYSHMRDEPQIMLGVKFLSRKCVSERVRGGRCSVRSRMLRSGFVHV